MSYNTTPSTAPNVKSDPALRGDDPRAIDWTAQIGRAHV